MQIGLICELLILQKLININIVNALISWVGPLSQKHDFNFTDWNLEIKGSRRDGHVHTINGIDQLKPAPNKNLAFISFIIAVSNHDKSFSLQDVIEEISKFIFQNRPDLTQRFYELLSLVGYSPVFAEEYRKLKVEVVECNLYHVNDSFPSLTTDDLIAPLNNRITAVRYNISLDGVPGLQFDIINWGNYFY